MTTANVQGMQGHNSFVHALQNTMKSSLTLTIQCPSLFLFPFAHLNINLIFIQKAFQWSGVMYGFCSKNCSSPFKLIKGRIAVTLSEHGIIMQESSLTKLPSFYELFGQQNRQFSPRRKKCIWKLWTVPIFNGPENITKICSSSLYWLVNVIYVYKSQQA